MVTIRKYQLIIAVAVFLAGTAVSAETWRLDKGQKWDAVKASSDEDKYLLAVSTIKELAGNGQTEALIEAFDKFKEQYPNVVGKDFEAFVNAEILLSQAKFAKAGRAYEKFLADFPDSELYDAVLDRQFAIATAFLGGEKKRVLKVFKIRGYAEGTKMMERLSDRAGDSPISVRAAVSVAESYEKRGKFDDAYQKWSQINSRWPTGQIGKDSLLGMARCKHAGYSGPKYDETFLISAKSYYENYKLQYPQDADKFGIDQKLEQINEQIAYKQFNIGKYYQKTGNKDSANLYYRIVIDEWPGTTASKMAKAAMAKKEPNAKKEEKWEKKLAKKLKKLFL